MSELLSAHHEQCPACKQMTLRVVVDPMTVEGRRILGCENKCDWENPPAQVMPIMPAPITDIAPEKSEVESGRMVAGPAIKAEDIEEAADVTLIEEEEEVAISMEESVKLMSRCRLLVRRAMRAEWPGTEEYVKDLEEIEQRRSGDGILGEEDCTAISEMIGELESALGNTQDVINRILDKLVVMRREQLTKLERWMRKNLLREDEEEEVQEEAGEGIRRNAGSATRSGGGVTGGRPRKSLEQMRATRVSMIQQAVSSGLLVAGESKGLDEMSLSDMDKLCQKIRMRAYKRRWADA